MATPTKSSSVIIPSLTPNFVFVPIPQATTCMPVTIVWSYSGPQNFFNFVVTNVDVPQDGSAPPLTSSTPAPNLRAVFTGANNLVPPVTVIIALNVDAPSHLYSWPSVSIPQGWYVVNANLEPPDYSATSNVFFVQTGSETSCIPSFAIPSTSSVFTTVVQPNPTGTLKVSVGAVVGSVAGGVTAIVVLLLLLSFQRRARKRPAIEPYGTLDIAAPPRTAGPFHALPSAPPQKRPALNAAPVISYPIQTTGKIAREDEETDFTAIIPTASSEPTPPLQNRSRPPQVLRHEDSGLRLPDREEERVLELPPLYTAV